MPLTVLVATAFVVLAAAVVQGASGIGFALVAVPLLTIAAVEPKEAVFLANGLGLITSTVLAVRGRAQIDRSCARRVMLGALAGTPVGFAVILLVDDRVLQGLIGIAVVAFVVLLASGWRLHRDTPALEVGAGVASGALNTALGTGGPPVTLLLQARGLAPGPFRATVSIVFVLVDVVACALLAGGGLVSLDVVGAFLAALPALAVGWWIGDRLHHQLPPERFRAGVLGLSALTGAVALAGALAG